LTLSSKEVANSRQVTKTDFVSKKEYFRHENPLKSLTHEFSSVIVGEEKNIETMLCVLGSAYLPDDFKLSAILINQSSTGKSHFINTILGPFREAGRVKEYTNGTEAFFKRDLGFIKNMILFIEQLEAKDENGKLNFGLIKHCMSEGIVRAGIVDTDEKGHKAAVEFKIIGIPVIVTTATSANIDVETENRFLVMDLDESAEQTKRIIKHKLNRRGNVKKKTAWDETKKELNHFYDVEFKEVAKRVEDIVFPFYNKIECLVPDDLEMRRNLDYILSLTGVIAVYNWRHRDIFENLKQEKEFTDSLGGMKDMCKGIIIAKPEDYRQACKIAERSFSRTLSKTSQRTKDIHKKLVQLFESEGLDATGISLKQLAESTKLPENTIRDHLDRLRTTGHVNKDFSERQHRFIPTKREFSGLSDAEIIFTDEEYQEWINANLDTSMYSYITSGDREKRADSCLKTPESTHETHLVSSRDFVSSGEKK